MNAGGPINPKRNKATPISVGSEVDIVKGWLFDDSISSHPDHCAPFIGVLLARLQEFGWNGRDAFGIRMAMEEAILNAIVHGNQRDPQKLVHVFVRLTSNRFYAKITDEGDGFDPHQVPDPTLDENLYRECGRGVMLIRKFVDSAQYNTKGNSVELKKTKTSAKS